MKLVTTTIIDGRAEVSPSQTPSTTFPTNIHLDLLSAGEIPDPHLGFNERSVQWVHEKTWRYSATFSIKHFTDDSTLSSTFRRQGTPEDIGNRRVCLVFEGLDTFATVYVDGEKILESDNMFLSHRVDITDMINKNNRKRLEYRAIKASTSSREHTERCKDVGHHTLTIDFESALKRGDELMAQNGGERVTWNGHYSRVFVRKAQYHYVCLDIPPPLLERSDTHINQGWDWGPSLITCGPWKPIHLQIYTDRIASVTAVHCLSPDLKKATLHLSATLETKSSTSDSGVYFVSASILSPSGKEIRLPLFPNADSNIYKTTAEIDNPELWYPHQHGPQNLYTVTFTLTTSSVSSGGAAPVSPMLDTVIKRFGIRRVRVVQDPLQEAPDDPVSGGKTFYFEVNNIPIFIGGNNWIPADSFLPRVSREQLQKLLKTLMLERGNQNMVRVWGGGVYESEEFYKICDEAGILVWQDICLACGDYPANLDSFVTSISEEVKQNLERLRWHPSLVLVAGNNEDYQVADEELGYEQEQPENEWRGSKFPGRWLYEKIFPEIVREVCNGGFGEGIGDSGEDGGGSAGVVYWPGSPWGGEDSTDRTIGDIHQWNSEPPVPLDPALYNNRQSSLGRNPGTLPTLS